MRANRKSKPADTAPPTERRSTNDAGGRGEPVEFGVEGIYPFIEGSTVAQARVIATFGSRQGKEVLARIHLLDGQLVMIFRSGDDDEDLGWLATPANVERIFRRLSPEHLRLCHALEDLPQFATQFWGKPFIDRAPAEVWIGDELSNVEALVRAAGTPVVGGQK